MTDEIGDEVTPLDHPADPLRPIVADLPALREAIAALAAGSGPLAVDTERAHGFRYLPKAYLLQFRRAGAGTYLIDPVAFADTPDDLVSLADSLRSAEWILHAASQDLPCLVDLDLRPTTLFDTELAARLLGYPRVALATLLEEHFGVRLKKEHSAADWSRRPLPHDWLVYAALDVELLVELRDVLAAELDAEGKDEWARQEFEHLVRASQVPTAARREPWRRTSGLHAVHTPLGLGIVRELWTERDRIAADLDRAPGRILPDRAISGLAAHLEKTKVRAVTKADLDAVSEFRWRNAVRYRANWLAAGERAFSLTRDQLPAKNVRSDGVPHPRTWERQNPEAAARWSELRAVVETIAQDRTLPVENLLQPDAQRALAWAPPQPATTEAIDALLAEQGARAWQRELLVGPLAALGW